MTKTESWNHALRREIAEQRAMMKRMGDPDNGLMSDIRYERLELLERLLGFEPESKRGPLLDEPEKQQ